MTEFNRSRSVQLDKRRLNVVHGRAGTTVVASRFRPHAAVGNALSIMRRKC